MAKRPRKTGQILPRNYGLRLAMPGRQDLFVSPAAYIIAQVMLETPKEIRTRLRDWSERHNEDYGEVEPTFVDAVEKREGSKNILNVSRRTGSRQLTDLALPKVRREQTRFTGVVKSKERGEYDFALPFYDSARAVNIGYPGARVGNEDNLYNEGKGKDLSIIGVHLAIPEIALAIDEQSGTPQWANMTGLFPRQRKTESIMPHLPFNFNFFKSLENMTPDELELYRLVTDLIVNYYGKNSSQYEMSVSALKNSKIFSSELVMAINSPSDRAQFKVLRQKEQEISLEPGSQEDRRHAAVTTLVDNISKYLQESFYYVPVGYCREFVGTPWETIARRFEPKGNGKGPVYSIAISDEHPPILVRKYLSHKSLRWAEFPDTLVTSHISQKLNHPYTSIDDVTRRESHVELVLPDETLRKKGIVVPEILNKEYDTLRERGK
ncbi:hypothetical protein AUJ84_00010 [Candidatus Pacearchaeota archaeon CG1_02_32_132]|nr:MAG: hypothetical protein AUJ84_00010 [Candidatus Pacearchaeota archaeon CG1_02_32_132]